MQMFKLILPQILNTGFSILCIAYLQLKGQILNFLIPQLIFLAFGLAFSLAAIRKRAQNVQQIDHSPIFFTILLLIQFASLLYLSSENISENLLCLLFGNMLSLQKLKSNEKNEKNEKKQFLNIKIMVQALSLLTIFVIIVLFKNISNNLEYIIIVSSLIIIVCSYEFVLSHYKHQVQQIEQSKVIVARRQSVLNQIQIPFQNFQGIWDRFNDQQYFFISYRNNEIVVEKMSQFLIQFLKEKCLSIEDYMKKIQLFQISYESEHILTNNMFEIKNANLYSFIRDQIIEEKQSAVMQRRKSQSNINEELQQQKLISPQYEQRQRLQSVQRNEMGNTLNLNNSSFQFMDREFLSASAIQKFDLLFVKPQENTSQMVNKKQQLYGLIQHDKLIYKKIQVSSYNQGLIIEIEDDSIENIKIQMNNIQNGYKQEVTQKEIQKLSQMLNDVQQKFNKMLNNQNRENKLLCQAQLQLYVLEIEIYNFIYFLSDGLPFPKQDQVNIITFLQSIKAKFMQDTTVLEKSIELIIQNDLNNQFITTDIRYLRQIIVNLLVNSIKAHRKPDISNTIYLRVIQTLNEEIKFEINDKASGFSQSIDFKRVREGKLGIFIVQKLLPCISKNPQLSFKTVHFENKQVGSSISFVLPRQMNLINNSLHNSSNNIFQQESYKLAQIMQSQLLTQNQDFI
ncbi:unnamed protein product [Paramecium sonneborni]|uniref:Histidine kinase domain-containing protein n=1 Tax=Paramecium sonneborni TaxID=65129 RepID=A0A8S1K7G4_9CILI|nr:unnamed protein product [Paramecium sonneborni]